MELWDYPQGGGNWYFRENAAELMVENVPNSACEYICGFKLCSIGFLFSHYFQLSGFKTTAVYSVILHNHKIYFFL